MTNTSEEKPPLFNSWRGWYVLVLGVLVVEILLFYWLTVSFS